MNTAHHSFSGSQWWKFDFHTHTPESHDAFKRTPCPDLKTWLLAFMRAGIDCVVVTDHNSGEALPKLQAAMAEMAANPPPDYRPLVIFPGVEISVHGGVHVLAVFDPTRGRDEIICLLDAAGYQGKHGDSDTVTQKSVPEVLQIISEKGGLAIPAHVDKQKGLFSEITGQSLGAVFDSEHIAAIELRDILCVKPGQYQTKRINWPEVLGSDTHNFQDSGDPHFPGSHYTWVKMDKPTLAALKLALHDGNAFSIKRSDVCPPSYDPNVVPRVWIESLSVSKARFMGNGEPEVLTFNPWMNAIIGGRGSGKSTIIHFLRLATKREDDLNLFDGQPGNRAKTTFDNFSQVGTGSTPGGLRAETVAEAVICKGEQRFRLVWKTSDRGVTVEEWNAAINGWASASSQDVTERFPVRLFSQDEIGLIAERPEALLRRLDESISKTKWEAQHTDAENKYIEMLGRYRFLRTKLADKDRLIGQRDDLNKQLAAFEKSEHAKIRLAFQKTSRQKREMSGLLDAFRELAQRIGALKDGLLLYDLPNGLVDPANPADLPLQHADDTLRSGLAEASNVLEQTRMEMLTLAQTVEDELRVSSWNEAAKTAERAHAVLMDTLKAQGVSDPAAYANLLATRQTVDAQLKGIDDIGKEINELATQISKSHAELFELRIALQTMRRDFLTKELQGNRYVRIELVPFGNEDGKDRIETEIRRELQCPDTRFISDIRNRDNGTGFVEMLYAQLPNDETARMSALKVRIDTWKRQVIRATNREKNEFGGHFQNHLAGKFQDRPEGLDRLRMWWPEDTLAVSYSRTGDGNNFVRLSSGGSAGEKAAALLAFFLAHGDAPLIIDQPENDLDNHLITNLVVKQLKTNKERRQIIVVTHNPNIVVNGDAELIHAMAFKAGQCCDKVSGALQEKAVRDEVCDVMEGGRTALKSRFQRLI